MASFDGVSFAVRAYTVPWESGIQVSERPIPCGTDVYIDVGGQLPEHVTITARFDGDSDRDAMRRMAQAGSVGTLSYVDGTFTAMITSMRRSDRYPNDVQIADLAFTLIS